MNMINLNETVELMNSENYQDRFKAEYAQLAIRYQKLVSMIRKWDDGTLDFEPDCPRGIYDLQIRFMADYLTILEARASIENIDLKDLGK